MAPFACETLLLSGATSLERLPEGAARTHGKSRQLSNARSSCRPAWPLPLSISTSATASNLTAIPESFAQVKLKTLNVSGCAEADGAARRHARAKAGSTCGAAGLTWLPPSLSLDSLAMARRARADARGVSSRDDHGRADFNRENVELRRVMLERVGMEWFIDRAQAEQLDADRDPGGERKLLRIRMADESLVCVQVQCPSTGNRYILRVPPDMRSCRQAVAWTAGFSDPDHYQPIQET